MNDILLKTVFFGISHQLLKVVRLVGAVYSSVLESPKNHYQKD